MYALNQNPETQPRSGLQVQQIPNSRVKELPLKCLLWIVYFLYCCSIYFLEPAGILLTGISVLGLAQNMLFEYLLHNTTRFAITTLRETWNWKDFVIKMCSGLAEKERRTPKKEKNAARIMIKTMTRIRIQSKVCTRGMKIIPEHGTPMSHHRKPLCTQIGCLKSVPVSSISNSNSQVFRIISSTII